MSTTTFIQVMDLNNSMHRVKVRAIAIVDLILSVASVIFPFVIFLVLINLTFALTGRYGFTEVTSRVIGFWVLFFAILAVAVLNITAAVKLFNSSQLNIEPLAAAKLARFWRRCTIVMTIILLAAIVAGKSFVLAVASQDGRNSGPSAILGLNLCFRSVSLYIVQQYIKELENMSRRLPVGNRVFYNVTSGAPVIMMTQLPPYSQSQAQHPGQGPPAYYHINPMSQEGNGPGAPPLTYVYPQSYYSSSDQTGQTSGPGNSPPPDYEEAMKRF